MDRYSSSPTDDSRKNKRDNWSKNQNHFLYGISGFIVLDSVLEEHGDGRDLGKEAEASRNCVETAIRFELNIPILHAVLECPIEFTTKNIQMLPMKNEIFTKRRFERAKKRQWDMIVQDNCRQIWWWRWRECHLAPWPQCNLKPQTQICYWSTLIDLGWGQARVPSILIA